MWSQFAHGSRRVAIATHLTMRIVVNRHRHLFKKFSGSPGRAQSIAINSPLPDSVM
jgi:hypothetical protein